MLITVILIFIALTVMYTKIHKKILNKDTITHSQSTEDQVTVDIKDNSNIIIREQLL